MSTHEFRASGPQPDFFAKGYEYDEGGEINSKTQEEANVLEGYGGQLIFIFPGLDLTVVTTSSPTTGDTRRSHRRTVFSLIEKHVIAPYILSLA